MTDLTARQIHLADQATPELLAAVDQMATSAAADHLAQVGEATYIAELTKEWLAASRLRLATWSAGLAIRLIQASSRLRDLTDELVAAKAESRRLRAELAEWQGSSDMYLIWSHHHQAWFGPNGCGYCQNVNDAGRYTLPDTRQWLGRGCYCCELPEVPVPVGQVLRAGSAELRKVIRDADDAAIKAGNVNQHYAGSEADR